ncbi:MAG: glycosyltransferase family 2 protein [Bacteroidales bacterium]|nr:glycosyltransferase family 2 protein [Bacteroidales bacterium]
MISVCIPIHDYYVYPLVRRLANEVEKLNSGQVEIVCIDDHSAAHYLTQNKGIADIADYYLLGKNIGRARIRNLFLKYTKGDYLLFLDCDSEVPQFFLKNYLKCINREQPQVVVGGRTYDKRGQDSEHYLRYLYGSKTEGRTAEKRRQHPYQSFMTNNFMVRREVLEKVRFDERLVKYGHEDTLFGYRLQQQGIPITHIDNQVVNGHIEGNAEFLHKSVEAVENLALIYGTMWEDQSFCQSVRLLRAYGKVRRWKLQGAVYWLFKLLKNPLEEHFVRGTGISIAQFNFYKLGLFIKNINYPKPTEDTDL